MDAIICSDVGKSCFGGSETSLLGDIEAEEGSQDELGKGGSVHQEIINTEPYDSGFGSRHNYTAISVRNNYGLDNIGDPTSYVKSSDVKLKEIDANGNKIGSSLSVN